VDEPASDVRDRELVDRIGRTYAWSALGLVGLVGVVIALGTLDIVAFFALVFVGWIVLIPLSLCSLALAIGALRNLLPLGWRAREAPITVAVLVLVVWLACFGLVAVSIRRG
jgi:hypothetical protein